MDSRHPLRIWIDKNSSQVKFAREIKCSESHLSDILAGKKQPSLKLAARMSAATGFVVPIRAFLTELDSELAPKAAEAAE